MSFAILLVFAQHLRQRGIVDVAAGMERTMKLLRVEEERLYLEEVDVREQRRLKVEAGTMMLRGVSL